MDNIDYLKKDHERILKDLLEFEEIINGKETDIDYWHLIYTFHHLTDILFQHEQNKVFLAQNTNNDYYMKIHASKMFLDQRRVKGHIMVMNKAILSKDIRFIKVALDTDGRMAASNIKDQIFREEVILDKLLYLHTNR